ncbi:hypothetical protein [Fulvimonas soli]|uniref:Uncharacterized protein n=1 Tax=Fulvimonas soli TaxID=155197 RepID=A0A316HQZ2_9GAMM|nr:hypothetical protein [Fulvimonas soli]PWK82369.1 hypothetical protein C7456_11614 [Fulvimonas soli]TNY26964.1 hypothetical protein BV497_06225 [Fulvimonas soli]
MLHRSGWLLGLGLLLASPLRAQEVPPPLQGWQDWVLHDLPQHACPRLATPAYAGEFQCAWPGRLALQADRDGGRFALDVHADAPGWVALPGDARAWPQQVQADGQPVPVLEHDGVPSVWLAAGDHALRGALPWSARPARLRVPAAVGLVALSVDGAAVARLERNGDELTLGEAAAAQRTADALSLRVYRRLQDGLPATLQTRLVLDVAGSAREQSLGPALPAGFVATDLQGELPARLENDGRLRVQLRPGHWELGLDARATAPLAKVAPGAAAAPWPARETWSYADDPGLRSTRVEGQAVDAAQAGVPDEWRELPAYALDAGNGLGIEQGARGDEGGQGDQLRLRRELWLDFDGGGFSAVDRLDGELRHRQRLDVGAPWQLQRAAQAGQPLLVSRGADGRGGVELRTRRLALEAGLRLPAHGAAPSGGWQLPLERIDAVLHLPPGYRLLGAAGADVSPDSWVAQWSLLDLFVLALLALLAGRLLGWRWAPVAAAFLLLALHEGGAPRWTLGVALALALLVRALPEGRLRAVARGGAVAAFALAVLWSLPFAAAQLEYALHPQLEQQRARVSPGATEAASRADDEVVAAYNAQPPPAAAPAIDEASGNSMPAPPAPPAPPSPVLRQARPLPSLPAKPAPKAELAAITVTAAALAAPDAHGLLQAGDGTPRWDVGNDYRLGWSGPVTPQQGTRLLIAPAWLVRLLRVALVALLAALLAKLALHLLRPLRADWHGWRRRGAGAAALLALALLPHGAPAQGLPSQAMLDALRHRLAEAPKCDPGCAALAQATLQTGTDTLDLQLELHAGATVAAPLPQPDAGLQLLDASVDGHPAVLAARDGQLLLRLERGVHRVGLRYRFGDADSAGLRFPLPPQRIAAGGAGWTVGGLDDGRLLGDSLAFSRQRSGGDGRALPPARSFPPYVRLTRRLMLGVDWTVENEVERIAPSDGGFDVSLPLLPGEHPLGEDAPVKDGRIRVSLRSGEEYTGWSSRLDRADALALAAPALGERAEVWEVLAAPMWHVEARGVPASASEEGLRFQPLPGERLELAVSQPPGVAGDSLAFDRVSLRSVAGERVTESTLELQARSTRGGEHAVALPPQAELLEASRDGEALQLALRDGRLGLPLLPGTHGYALRVRTPGGAAAGTRTPAFALGAPAANLELGLQLPQDRWVLWTWGPALGPAVLYWAQLAVLLLAAWLLARHAPTPLRFRHWLLLGLGFSAFAWSAYALVVLWLILLGLRARGAPARLGATGFNLLQLGLAALTALALAVLVSAVPRGLLGLPDMHVAGNGSTAWALRWLADRSAGALPQGGVFSLPLWVYKLAMLAWALWLANALIGWLRWGFEAWSRDGYWRRREPKRTAEPPAMPPPEPPHG